MQVLFLVFALLQIVLILLKRNFIKMFTLQCFKFAQNMTVLHVRQRFENKNENLHLKRSNSSKRSRARAWEFQVEIRPDLNPCSASSRTQSIASIAYSLNLHAWNNRSVTIMTILTVSSTLNSACPTDKLPRKTNYTGYSTDLSTITFVNKIKISAIICTSTLPTNTCYTFHWPFLSKNFSDNLKAPIIISSSLSQLNTRED